MPKTVTREELDAIAREDGVTVVRKRTEAERLAKAVSLDLEHRYHALSQQLDALDERLTKELGDRDGAAELVADLARDVAELGKELERVTELLEAPRPTYEFDVQRDGNGKITKVVATPRSDA